MTTTPRTETGRYRNFGSGDTAYRAFVPAPLPPDLRLTEEDYDLMERANRALGRLDGISSLLPDRDLFLYLYVRKEAVLSSQIEGTQSSLTDLLQHEDGAIPGVPLDDVQEVSNYVAALNHGLKRLRDDGFPLSLRLLREIHGVLLKDGRGANKTPGEFRRSQVWIGGGRPWTATFVPPPPDELDSCLDAFEKYLHRPGVPILIKAALAHVQFETIHPFLDGNGRVGRLLITFLLCAEDVLTDPLLYLSLFFKTNRDEYYERLQRVRTHGEWEGWLRYFLRGVQETSKQAVDTAREILALFEGDRVLIREGAGRSAGSVLQVQEVMQRRPLVTIAEATRRSGLTYATVRSALETLERLGLVREVPDRLARTFHYERYLDMLEQGTEPL